MLKKVGNPNLWVQFEQKVPCSSYLFHKIISVHKEIINMLKFYCSFVFPMALDNISKRNCTRVHHEPCNFYNRAKNAIYWIYTVSSSIRWPISKTNTHSTFFEQLVSGNKAQLQLMNCSSYTFRKKGWGSSEGRSCLLFFFVCLFFNNLLLFLFCKDIPWSLQHITLVLFC